MTSGLSLIVVAIAAITVLRSFDGFVQGLLSGSGIVLMITGVAALSPLLRRSTQERAGEGAVAETEGGDEQRADASSGREEGWLPTRDNRL
jgi:hypothetical protein